MKRDYLKKFDQIYGNGPKYPEKVNLPLTEMCEFYLKGNELINYGLQERKDIAIDDLRKEYLSALKMITSKKESLGGIIHIWEKTQDLDIKSRLIEQYTHEYLISTNPKKFLKDKYYDLFEKRLKGAGFRKEGDTYVIRFNKA